MVNMQSVGLGREPIAALATVSRFDPGNPASPFPGCRAVERGAVAGHAGHDTPCGALPLGKPIFPLLCVVGRPHLELIGLTARARSKVPPLRRSRRPKRRKISRNQ
jgi:hypothetical protein